MTRSGTCCHAPAPEEVCPVDWNAYCYLDFNHPGPHVARVRGGKGAVVRWDRATGCAPDSWTERQRANDAAREAAHELGRAMLDTYEDHRP